MRKTCPHCSTEVGLDDKFCRNCAADLSSSADVDPVVSQLVARVNALEGRLNASKVYDEDFWQRARAMWGHVMAIQVLVAVTIWLLFAIFWGIFS